MSSTPDVQEPEVGAPDASTPDASAPGEGGPAASAPEHDGNTVRLGIEIDAPPDRAFQVFTQRFDLVKPRHHNLMAVDIAESVLEPWVGGRLYDRGVDGSLCRWGQVLVVEAPHRLRFSWDISPRWAVETDPARCSEVEVTFAAITGGRTQVTVEHRHLDRHGDGWEGERDAVAGDDGWPIYLAHYRKLIAERTP